MKNVIEFDVNFKWKHSFASVWFTRQKQDESKYLMTERLSGEHEKGEMKDKETLQLKWQRAVICILYYQNFCRERRKMFACSIRSRIDWLRREPIKLIHELFKCKSHNCFQQWPCYLILLICALANILGLSSTKHPPALVPHLLTITFHLASEASKWEIQLSLGAMEIFFYKVVSRITQTFHENMSEAREARTH